MNIVDVERLLANHNNGTDPLRMMRLPALEPCRDPYFPSDAEGAHRARSASEAFLFRRLETLPEICGRFRLNAELSIPFDGSGKMEVDLLCVDARVAIEVDGALHLADTVAYRRDRRKDRALPPVFDGFRLECRDHALEQCVAAGSSETHQEQTRVSARRVAAHIRKVQVLCDEEALRRLRRAPDVWIDLAVQWLGIDRVHVVTKSCEGGDEAIGQILVEFDLHRLTGVSTSGRSS